MPSRDKTLPIHALSVENAQCQGKDEKRALERRRRRRRSRRRKERKGKGRGEEMERDETR